MKLVEVHIARQQAGFARHPFFEQIKASPPFPDVLGFAPDLTFWVMAFQDIIRLNARMTKDPEIRKIVRHHLAEDLGHDRWFLHDLSVLKVAAPEVTWLFSKRHLPTRDAAYALVSEVFRAADDRLRLVLVQVLESAGHVFFERVAAAVGSAGETLKYFSYSHLDVEKNHEVFEKKMKAKISAMQLPPSLRTDAEELVDRCYAAFFSMFDALSAGDQKNLDQAPLAAAGRSAGRARAQR